MSGFSLQGRNAVVTGGSRGLGRAIALRLADAGANVALTYRARADDAHAVAREIESKGRLAIALKMDVTDPASVERAANEARSALGPLSVLVNNAGINMPRAMQADGAAALEGGLKGPFRCAQLFLPLLAESGIGAVVHVGIIGIRDDERQAAPHAASKSGLIALSQAIAREGAAMGVRSNAVAAGLIQSDMADAALSSAIVQKSTENIPLKRLSLPLEVADAVIFLACDASSYITAQTLNVNGGLYS